MRIVLFYTHHRRCIAHYYRRAFEMLGHDVKTCGPWADDYTYGTSGREPSGVKLFMNWPPIYDFVQLKLKPEDIDFLLLIDMGENLVLRNIPPNLKWAHLSLEGSHLDWSDTPLKFYGIARGDEPKDAEWLPAAFDPIEHRPGVNKRCYDLCQVATPRAARQMTWNAIKRGAPDLHCMFGEVWGPIYAAIYQNSLSTFVCSTQNFVTIRVFEAMAMGCVVLADRVPMMGALFNEGEHYIGYDSVPCADERGPDPAWLVNEVRRLRRDGDGGMAQRAYELVATRHSWMHRAARILQRVNEG